MHPRNRNNHGLGDPPDGRKNDVFEWSLGGGDLHGSTKGICTRGEKNISCVNSRNFPTSSSNCRGRGTTVSTCFFINKGFRRSQTDYSSYIKQTNEHLWVVILYMDDLIILASNIIQLNWLKLELNFLLLQNKQYCEKYSAEYYQSHKTLL